jgi:hypothetical protein
MTIPTLTRRPTHRVLPLLASEVSRLSHRRLFRVLTLLLLGGIVLVSAMAFLNSSSSAGWTEAQMREQQARQQGYWEECAAGFPTAKDPEQHCGKEPLTQPIDRFDYGSDRRYQARQNLPLVVVGVAIGVAVVGFIMGASSGGAEWSSRSMTLQLLFEPRRLRLLVVKWLGLGIVVVALAAVAMLVALGLGALTAGLRGTWDTQYSDLLEPGDALGPSLAVMGLRGLVLVAIAATLGYAIAMLVRNTGASLGVAFVYFVVVENVARFALLRYGTQPFLLAENSAALIVPGGIPVVDGVEGPANNWEYHWIQLTNLRAFATLLGYAVLLSIPAAWSFTRRDVA